MHLARSLLRVGAMVVAGLSLAASSGCSSPPTQLLVVVNTDIPVPDQMRLIRARVVNRDDLSETSAEFVVGPSAAQVALPFSFGVVPVDGDASRRISVILEGYSGERAEDAGLIVTRRANTGFLEGRTLRLPMFLFRNCIPIVCTGDMTCINGMCRSPDIDPASLQDVVPGRELEDPDASTSMDAARSDAGPSDAGLPPPECVVDMDCDDDDRCNGIETCAGGRCAPGVRLMCRDAFACTEDLCEAATGCVHVPDETICPAGPGRRCDPTSGCQYSVCTATTCTADPAVCLGAVCDADGMTCNRASTCTTSEFCCNGACVAAGCDDGNPCTDDACGTTGCTNVANTNPCDDGLGCTTADTCAATVCTGTDTCDDGDACNGGETCTSGGCMPGMPVNCMDAVGCTDDSCDPGTGACSHVTNDSLCAAGPMGRCDAVLDCQYTTCTASTCTPTMGCQNAMCVGSVCMRNSLCTASQMCCGTACVPFGCEDGNPCTNGSCGGSICIQAPNSDPCDDSNRCTTGDRCSAGACGGSPVSCDDGNVCTDDSCSTTFGCQNFANSGPCNDGMACTVDMCIGGTCNGSSTCADGDPCTMEMCVGATCMSTGGGGCTFMGTCIGVGDSMPGNECMICQPGGTFLPAPGGTMCGGGALCCFAGTCNTCVPDAGTGFDAGADSGPGASDSGVRPDAGRDAGLFTGFDAGSGTTFDSGIMTPIIEGGTGAGGS